MKLALLVAMLPAGAQCEARHNRGGGVHIVVRLGNRVFDFWPASAKWRQRDNNLRPGSLAVHRSSLRSGVGLGSLLAALTEAQAA